MNLITLLLDLLVLLESGLIPFSLVQFFIAFCLDVSAAIMLNCEFVCYHLLVSLIDCVVVPHFGASPS